MALDILKTILAEEQRANDAIIEAQQNANETVKNAEASILEQERQAAVDNRALYQRLMEESRTQIARELDAKKDESLARINNVITPSRARLAEVEDWIIYEVFHGHI
jgi:vacuolar-type H+-ATPase subunit H